MDEKTMTKVKDLTPASKQVNVLVKVVGLSEEREITSKFGEARKLVEATVGDETATVLLTLWNDQIGQVQKDETVLVDNGYVTLVRGHIRLNVGKYGSMTKSDQTIEPWLSSVRLDGVSRSTQLSGVAEAAGPRTAPASDKFARAAGTRAARCRRRGRSPR